MAFLEGYRNGYRDGDRVSELDSNGLRITIPIFLCFLLSHWVVGCRLFIR
jgi:hypothetical protein